MQTQIQGIDEKDSLILGMQILLERICVEILSIYFFIWSYECIY